MKITFETPKEIVVVKEVKKTITELLVLELIDNPEKKTVIAITKEFGPLLLWEGPDYDTIGQWTDTDAITRITEIIG